MSDKLFFFSKSDDVYPGEGENEYVADKEKYKELSKIKKWRSILSCFYEFTFVYKDLKYRTAEHAFYSEKAVLIDKDLAYNFALQSGTDLAYGNGLIALRRSKKIRLPPPLFKKWNQIKSQILVDVLTAKFTQCLEAKNVLINTGNAEMWHAGTGETPQRWIEYEKVRDLLRQK
jgi:predicted NAD-dependent protein-ADP-ribosyltransferase YbiA (DUF1768 family)